MGWVVVVITVVDGPSVVPSIVLLLLLHPRPSAGYVYLHSLTGIL